MTSKESHMNTNKMSSNAYKIFLKFKPLFILQCHSNKHQVKLLSLLLGKL